MGVKFAHAFGAHVVVFTTSPGKKEAALGLGADEVVVSRNAADQGDVAVASEQVEVGVNVVIGGDGASREAQELGTGKNHGCGQGASESEAR
jgi:D-arabinose 1-dehydrogenase-like Zn-dependent alcohol dehydrogenase